jgi:tetratricopeptide (TPR) repeat protein
MATTSDPQSLAAHAKRIYESGDFLAASQAFAETAASFTEAGDKLMAAEMNNNQSVALLRARQPQAALEAVAGTEAVFAEAGDFRRLGMAQANRASALEALKHYPDAIAAYKEAGEALEKAGEDQLRVQVMQLLSALYLRRWKFLDAVITLQSGLAGVKNPTPKQRLMKKFLFFRL